ncbi:MAG: RsmB/NOP family class I SAM-dependent RNA methyltransferase [Candidatus Bathyarchaeota archaeon]|nr:RsmB/NOP family class I SAM-dependent RNA methyltransferase [Candidatus Termiticorpusculum sp.]MCL1970272.1 RsmB/NOP family class I SAM-dependent RNA methyltransferase [Candidatus Termiticorpusculum sp.]
MLKNAWTIAIETLSWIEMQRLSEHIALVKTIKQLNETNSNAIRYAYGLVVETTRHKNLIDKFINAAIAPKKIEEFNLGLQSFLRLYVYQTRITKNWTKNNNIQEAQNIASTARSILGWKTMLPIEPYLGFLLTQNLQPILETIDAEERLSLETFQQTWFVKYCINLLGSEEAALFLRASNTPPPAYIRINTLKGKLEDTLQKLADEGVKLKKAEPLQDVYRVLELKQPLHTLESFKQGLFYVQDKASCFAAQTATPKPGNKILDICAAPGAKTTYLAQLMQNQGSITSIDFSKRRMKTWRQEINYMGVTIAEAITANACSSLPSIEVADIVVLDPPCTSTGVFAKQPSAKWRLSKNSIENMAEVQQQMITNCAQHVAAGGYLIYSTCSITVEENELVIERFLAEHSDFRLVDLMPEFGLPGLRGLTKCRRLYPHLHDCNGFFVAKLQRVC